MIITFATQKGGTGKTTLAIAFANYISSLSERKINVFDFDYQKSFYHKWKEDEFLDLRWIQMSNATLGFIKLVKNLKQIDLKLSFQKRLLAFDNPVPFWAFR